MIRLHEASLLAFTKLKTRKVRLFVIILISCLLFGLLVALSLVVRGGLASVESFGDEGFGKRYISGASSVVTDPGELMSNQDIIDRSKELYDDLVKRKTAEAKKVGIEYDPKNEPLPYDEFDNGDGTKSKNINQSPLALQATREYLEENPYPGLPELRAIADGYDPLAFYEMQPIDRYSGEGFALKVLIDGKEEFTPSSAMPEYRDRGLESFPDMWNIMSKDLLEPFVMEGSNLEIGEDGSIPVLAPYSAAEQILGLSPLPSGASAEQKLERIKKLRNEVGDKTFSICYRNAASNALVDQALSVQDEIERGKDDENYIKPSYITDVPSKPCGATRVSEDTRSELEKTEQKKYEDFEIKFGAQKPRAIRADMRIVGVVPDYDMNFGSEAADILSMVLISGIGTGWYTPYEATESSELVGKVFPESSSSTTAFESQFVEFASAADSQRFIEEQTCSFDESSFQMADDPFKKCKEEGKLFTVYPFGSNSLAITEIKNSFNQFFQFAILGVAGLAALIMTAAVGRVIADSRRETAVFRAIGAKRIDIAQIYIMYTVFVSLVILVISALVGAALALYIDATMHESLSLQAVVVFNSSDLTREFRLLGIELRDAVMIAAAVIVAGLASALIPLLTNVRRNPIRDMRDDT